MDSLWHFHNAYCHASVNPPPLLFYSLLLPLNSFCSLFSLWCFGLKFSFTYEEKCNTCLSVSTLLHSMRWSLVSFIPRLHFVVNSWLPFFSWSVLLYNLSQLYFPIVCFPVSSSSTARFLGPRDRLVQVCLPSIYQRTWQIACVP